MSRHRHVRNLDTDAQDLDHEDEHEEDEHEEPFGGFSPTSRQYIYDRGAASSLAAWASPPEVVRAPPGLELPAAAAPAQGMVPGYEADYQDSYGGFARASDKKKNKKNKNKKKKENAAPEPSESKAKTPLRTAPRPDAEMLGTARTPAAGAAGAAAAAAPPPPRSPTSTPPLAAPALARSESSSIRNAAAHSSRRAAERSHAVEQQLSLQSKDQISMVCIGHVDAGKSTLMGHLLLQTGRVDQRTVRKFEKESRDAGKASFHFAWVMDQHAEERSRGVTVDVGVNHFETATKSVTMLDAPGHRDFIPNMISGAAQADVAVLVVPAVRGEFESGFAAGGQTKEHAILAKSLGVTQLIVAVNKLDAAGWDQARYESIVAELAPFLRLAGFRDGAMRAVPVSGLTGENIAELREPALRAWYDGPTLLELVDTFRPAERAVDRPFRFCVSDVFRAQSLGLTVAGRVVSGSVLPKDRLLLMPSREVCTVKGVEDRGAGVAVGLAGQNLEIGLRGLANEEAVAVGMYLCDPGQPVPLVACFRARVVTMELELPILKGSQLELFTQSVHEPATVTKLVSLLDKATGEVTRRRPRHLTRNTSAVVEIRPGRALCLELYRDFRQLGRFSLRRAGHTVAVGIVTEIRERL